MLHTRVGLGLAGGLCPQLTSHHPAVRRHYSRVRFQQVMCACVRACVKTKKRVRTCYMNPSPNTPFAVVLKQLGIIQSRANE